MADGDLGSARGSVDISVTGALAALASLRASSAATVGSLNTVGRASINAGLGIAGIGAAIVGGFAIAVKKTAELEKRLSFIKGIAGLTDVQMEALRKTTIKLGQDSAYTAFEVADGFTELAKAGATSEQIIGGMGEAMITLGQASDISLDKAATTIVAISSTFDLAANKADHIADIIQGAANASIASVDDLAVSMKYAGGVAANLGISFEDTATALAVLANNGIRGSTAGTSLRRILLQLTPRTAKAAKEMRKLGIITKDGANIFYDAHGRAKDFADITQILYEKTKKLTPELRQKAFATIFGDRAINSAIALSKDGAAGFEKMYKAVGNVKAADVAAERLNNLAGAWEIFKGALDSALISAGTPAQKPLTQLVQLLTKLVNAFTNLNPATQELITRIALITAGLTLAVGGFLIFAGSMLRAYAIIIQLRNAWLIARAATLLYLRTALAAIGSFLISPLGLAVLAVAALVAAFVIAYNKSETFRKKVQDIGNTIKNDFLGVFDEAKYAFEHAFEGYNLDTNGPYVIFKKLGQAAKYLVDTGFPAVKRAWDSTIGGIADTATTLASKVTDFVEAFRFNGPYAEGVNLDKVMQALHEVMNNLQPLVDKVKEAWAGFTKALHEAWQMIEPTLLPAIQQIKDAFNNDLMPALTKLGGIINANVIPAIKVLGTIIGGAVLIIIALILKLLPIIIRVGAAIVTTVIDVIAPVIAALVGILSGAFRIIGGLIQVFIGLFTGDWSKMWEGIKNIFGGAWDAIVALFQGAWNTIFAIVAGAIRIVVAFFVGLYNTLVGHSIIPDMINAIIGWFLRLPGAIGGAIAKVVSAIIAWAGNIAARGARAAQGFLDSVMARFNNLKGLIGTAISNAVSSITGFAQQAWDNAKKLGSSIWEGFKKGMGISSPSFIERAMVQVGKVTNDQVANLAEQVRYMQRLGSTIPDFSSNFVPATIPATQMAPVRQAALADQQTMAQANSIAAQLKAIGVNQQRPIAMHIGTVEDGDSLFRRARAADKMLSMAEGGDSQQIGGLGI